jgi:3-hydroxyacyl-CoA dehydrogenase
MQNRKLSPLAETGYVPPVERTDILALGAQAQAAIKLALHMMRSGGFISDHDHLIGTKLAKIMSGGDLNHTSFVSERYLLDLEREAFLSLCGERKTQERIAGMLKTGKPLRN